MKKTVYEIILDKIVNDIETKKVLPWNKPWTMDSMPQNFVTKHKYRGINFLLLINKFNSPYWVTYNQLKKLNGKIKDGESKNYTIITYYKLLAYKNNKDEVKNTPMFRYYRVYNTDQCEDLTIPESEINDFNTIEKCESIIDNMPLRPEIKYDKPMAYYSPSLDYVNIPIMNSFKAEEEYYSTLFHELTHSTGHKSRLNRKTITDCTVFGSTNYSKEELVAEIGASFLCGFSGIENKTIDNSIAYLNSWLAKFKKDPKLIVQASSQAQKACDFILNTNKKEN